jgi:uncharacterized protein
MLRALLAALVLAGAAAPVTAQTLQPLPAPASRVTDQTGTLTAGQQAELEQKLADFEQRKGAQLALLIVASTAPESIEQYSFRVVEAWKLGREASDDGVLLLVALEDRALRIEVGDGLEGVLPDAIARRIIEETIKPQFRQQDYFGGISAGLARIMQVVDGEPLPPPDRQWRAPIDRIGSILPLLFFGVIAGSLLLHRLLGRPLGSLATGGVTGGIVWLVSKLLGAAIGIGVLAFLFSLLLGFARKLRGGGSGWGSWPGGFGGGGFGGFGGGGFGGAGRGGGFGGAGRGGGFGGGFRGGGGRFSGGGASGRW